VMRRTRPSEHTAIASTRRATAAARAAVAGRPATVGEERARSRLRRPAASPPPPPPPRPAPPPPPPTITRPSWHLAPRDLWLFPRTSGSTVDRRRRQGVTVPGTSPSQVSTCPGVAEAPPQGPPSRLYRQRSSSVRVGFVRGLRFVPDAVEPLGPPARADVKMRYELSVCSVLIGAKSVGVPPDACCAVPLERRRALIIKGARSVGFGRKTSGPVLSG